MPLLPMTSVSVRADRDYTLALKALAYSRGQSVGDLVKDALDAQYGDQLQQHIAFFAAKCGKRENQKESEHAG